MLDHTEPMSDDAEMATRLWRMEQIQQIEQLKARYLRAVDAKDWDLMAAVLTPDAVLEVAGNTRNGSEEIIAVMSSRLAEFTTVHHGHMPEITIVDERSATGIWAMEDILSGPSGIRHGYGHYHERYVCDEDGAWRISHIRLVRIEV